MPPLTLAHTLYLVRHGETDWNREGRLQGGQEIPLNGLGREQAREAAIRLRGLVSGYDGLGFLCSPMDRARETMTILRRELGLPPGFACDERLRELGFGRWEGFVWRDIRRAEPAAAKARAADKWGTVPPGGESYAMLAERIRPVFSGISRDSVVVSHGGVMRALLALAGVVSPARAADEDIWQGRVLVLAGGEATWV